MSPSLEAGLAHEGTSLVPGTSRAVKFSITFNIETLRLIAFLSFNILLFTCAFITKHFVDEDMDQTVVAKIFGFNHSCNVMDFNPAREVAALMVMFFILPMVVFLVLSYYRTKYAYECGEVPRSLYLFSKITTPFNVIATFYIYMIFVNPPTGDYGILAHYIPYAAFQLMIALVSIQQVHYLIHIDKIPFGVSPILAKAYYIFLCALTLFYQLYVITILAGTPILDSANNDTDRLIAMAVAKVYGLVVLILPVIFAAIERKNGDVNTIQFG